MKTTSWSSARHADADMKTIKTPSLKTMTRWMMDGVARATDGCRVEPDGTCQHGAKSWLIVLGYI